MGNLKEIRDLSRFREQLEFILFDELISLRSDVWPQLIRQLQGLVKIVQKGSVSRDDLLKHLDRTIAIAPWERGRSTLKRTTFLLSEWILNLPESKRYVQPDAAFDPSDTDSALVALLKRGKRLRRRLMSLRGTSGKEEGNGRDHRGEFYHTLPWRLIGRDVSLRMRWAVHADIREELRLYVAIVDLSVRLVEEPDSFKDAGFREELDRVTETAREARKSVSDRLRSVIDDEIGRIETFVPVFGTVAWPEQRLRVSVLDQRESELEEFTEKDFLAWQEDVRVRGDLAYASAGIVKFVGNLRETVHEFRDGIREKRTGRLRKKARDASSFLTSVADRFGKDEESDKGHSQLVKKVEESKKDLKSQIIGEFTGNIIRTIGEWDLAGEVEELTTSALLLDQSLPVQILAFERKAKTGEPPCADFDTIELRSELLDFLKFEVFRKLRRHVPELHQKLMEIREDAGEIEQIVDVNLSLASEMLANLGKNEPTSEILELIHDGLDRSARRCDHISELLDAFDERLDQILQEILGEFETVCRDMVTNRDYFRLGKENLENRVIETATGWRSRLSRATSAMVDTLELRYRFVQRFFSSGHGRLRKILGFSDKSSGKTYIETRATEFLSDTERKLSELPLIYRRLFTREPLREARYFKGRTSLETRLSEAFSDWQSDQFSNFMIIGEKGSGKTSCLNLYENSLFGEVPVCRGAVENTTWDEQELCGILSDILAVKKVDSREKLIA